MGKRMLLRLAVPGVNETLFDPEPLGGRLESVGALRALLETWFAGTLRDGFALTARASRTSSSAA